MKEVTKEGKHCLEFQILGHKCAPVSRKIVAERFERITVRSSNGETSERYEVTLKIKIGPKVFPTSFSLTDRSLNVFPVLIGREALKKRFIVDPEKTSVNRAQLAKEFGIVLDSNEDSED